MSFKTFLLRESHRKKLDPVSSLFRTHSERLLLPSEWG